MGLELSEFDIQFKPCLAIKSQVLADFIAEYTIFNEGTLTLREETIEDEVTLSGRPQILHVDRSSTPAVSGAGIILANPDREAIKYAHRFAFSVFNNEAEYEALITGLRLAIEL